SPSTRYDQYGKRGSWEPGTPAFEPRNQGTREPRNQGRKGFSGPDKTPGDACWVQSEIGAVALVLGSKVSWFRWFPGSMVPWCPLVPSLYAQQLVLVQPRVVTAKRYELLVR